MDGKLDCDHRKSGLKSIKLRINFQNEIMYSQNNYLI